VKKCLVLCLFLMCAATSVVAAETAVTPAPNPVTVDAVATAAPMTLSAALDKVARNYRDMWIPDREGKKMKRACDLACTEDCGFWRDYCIQQGGGSTCWAQWEICMCENGCCWGPQGNPYCN
jgi:hypothetical protein